MRQDCDYRTRVMRATWSPDSVAFESRRLETWWTQDILGYRDAPAAADRTR